MSAYIRFSIIVFFLSLFLNTIQANTNILTKNSSLTFYNSHSFNTSDNKYCQICCLELQANTIGKNCGSHTLCKYAGNKIGPACKGFIRVGFTQAEKRLIVDAHNTIRNKVASGKVTEGLHGPQPSATNMRAVEWDDELAKIADHWAAQCIFGNDICRDIDKFPIGQNIARGILATDAELTLIQNWYQEVNNFDPKLVESFILPRNGHSKYARYSQLVWADTYLIGCARAIFQMSKGSKVKYSEHLICNYGPTGNIPNQSMYRIGEPCSECHEGTACNSEYDSLCATDLSEEFNDYLVLEKISGNAVKCFRKPTIIVLNVIVLLAISIIKFVQEC